jgi:uncharacterized membrane protein
MTPVAVGPKPDPTLIALARRDRIRRNKMSDKSLSIGPARFLRTVMIGLAVTVVLILATGAAQGRGPAAVLGAFLHLKVGPLHAPNLGLLAVAPIQIQIHVAAVFTALAVGTTLMLGLKGDTVHRTLGWVWVVAMTTAAISSLFIHRANGGFSFLHLFAGWTLIALPMAVFAARKHNVRLHSRTMTGLFVGGLLIAGAFAFMPGRLMWQMVFG